MTNTKLRNGTYLREPDGSMYVWYSPYSFVDALANWRKRDLYDDGWEPVIVDEEIELLRSVIDNGETLKPGEYVHIFGGEVV